MIAYYNPGIDVTVVDMNKDRIAQWQSRHLPIHEPGLHHLVRITRDGTDKREPNLFFSTECSSNIALADIVFLSVNTPTKTYGHGAGRATEMSMFLSAVDSVARDLKPGAIIVEKSTVPCRTAETINSIVSLFCSQICCPMPL